MFDVVITECQDRTIQHYFLHYLAMDWIHNLFTYCMRIIHIQ